MVRFRFGPFWGRMSSGDLGRLRGMLHCLIE